MSTDIAFCQIINHLYALILRALAVAEYVEKTVTLTEHIVVLYGLTIHRYE